jgi:hypothetical protein
VTDTENFTNSFKANINTQSFNLKFNAKTPARTGTRQKNNNLMVLPLLNFFPFIAFISYNNRHQMPKEFESNSKLYSNIQLSNNSKGREGTFVTPYLIYLNRVKNNSSILGIDNNNRSLINKNSIKLTKNIDRVFPQGLETNNISNNLSISRNNQMIYLTDPFSIYNGKTSINTNTNTNTNNNTNTKTKTNTKFDTKTNTHINTIPNANNYTNLNTNNTKLTFTSFDKAERKAVLDRLLNVKCIEDPYDPHSFINKLSASPLPSSVGYPFPLLGVESGHVHIDILSLENLLKSFFKKLYSLISLPILEYLPDKLNIRLFYYLKKNAKTYYSSTNIINSNLRSIIGLNFRLSKLKSIPNKKRLVEGYPKEEEPVNLDYSSSLPSPEGLGGEAGEDGKETVFGDTFSEEKSKHCIPLPIASVSNNTLIGLLEKADKSAKSSHLDYRTIKGNYNTGLSFILSSPMLNYRSPLSEKKPYLNTITKDVPKFSINKISNYSTNLIDVLRKIQSRSRAMQIFSLKYYWSNVFNPSLDYYNVLDNLNNSYQGYYSSNIDALVTNSNSLKLHLFSKWRGEKGETEYQQNKQFNTNTRILQDEMTIKEAILFSNPLFKEILNSQSLIYPYNMQNTPTNERLALFYKTRDNKMTFFNKTLKRASRSGAGRARIRAANFHFKLIRPWKSIAPIKLNTLKRDLYKNGVLFQNSTLKHIFNTNLAKLNLIFFLDSFKELKGPWHNTNNSPLNQFNIISQLEDTNLRIIQPKFKLELHEQTKLSDNSFSVYNTSLTSAKLLTNINKTILLFRSILLINSNLTLKEVNVNTKSLDINSLNPKEMFKVKESLWRLWQDREDRDISTLSPCLTLDANSLTLSPVRIDIENNKQRYNYVLEISVTNNISANSLLYTIFDKINGKDVLISPKPVERFYQMLTKLSLNIGNLSMGDLSSNFLNKQTNILLKLGDNYKNKPKLVTSSGINIITSVYKKKDREIDNPRTLFPKGGEAVNNKKSKGLVSYNKILFKKLLVFLKLIFNKEIELDLTRIKNPYNDTHILNQILGEVIKVKSKSLHRLIQTIRENTNIKPKFILELEHNKSQLPSTILSANSKELITKTKINNTEKDFIQDKFLNSPYNFPIVLAKANPVEREKGISTYNNLALEKWSNLNQLNKQKKINKTIFSDIKNIGLNMNNNNQLLNEKNINIEGEIFTDRKVRHQPFKNVNYTNWRNTRNNFNFSYIPLEILTENLQNSFINTTRKDIYSKQTQSKLSANLTIYNKDATGSTGFTGSTGSE